jgi:hypothetical protein
MFKLILYNVGQFISLHAITAPLVKCFNNLIIVNAVEMCVALPHKICYYICATTLSIMTLSIMTLTIMALSKMTLSIMTLSIMTFCIMTLLITPLRKMTPSKKHSVE